MFKSGFGKYVSLRVAGCSCCQRNVIEWRSLKHGGKKEGTTFDNPPKTIWWHTCHAGKSSWSMVHPYIAVTRAQSGARVGRGYWPWLISSQHNLQWHFTLVTGTRHWYRLVCHIFELRSKFRSQLKVQEKCGPNCIVSDALAPSCQTLQNWRKTAQNAPK